jgi:dienelactone hydrolase
MKKEMVEFENQGEKAFGILRVPDVKNPPAIIITHGYGGFIFEKRYELLASKLCKAGYAVLTLIFRGYDSKTGNKDKKHFKNITISGEMSDLKLAIDFLYKKGYEKIGFTAECFGGTIALLLNDPRINAIAFWSINIYTKITFENLYGRKIIKDLEEKGRAIYISRTTGEKFTLKRELWNEVKRNRIVPKNKIKKVKCPMLIIYGDNDKLFDVKVFKELYKIANKPKKLVVIKGADHIFSKPEHLKEMINSIIEWFDKWLK